VQAAVAVLSCGPVAPGDRAGAANRSLLLRTCRSDGLLLKPGYPAVAAQAVLDKRASGEWAAGRGEVTVAYTQLPRHAAAEAGAAEPRGGGPPPATFAAVLGIDLDSRVTLSAADLGFGAGTTLLVWDMRRGPGSARTAPAVVLRPCGQSDFQLLYVTVAAPTAAVEAPGDGKAPPPVLLGEAGKLVPHSPLRFASLGEDGTARIALADAAEAVAVWFWMPAENKVVKAECRGATAAVAGVENGEAFCSGA
jgi:hypothetical protein